MSFNSFLVIIPQHAYDSVLITDADLEAPGPRIIYANDAFCRKTGYSLNELIGQSPRILQGPLTDPKVLQRLHQALTANEQFEGSTINYRKDGSTYVVRWSISPIYDEQGKVNQYVSIQRDITHETELEQSNKTILNSLGEGVIGIDAQGTCSFANPAALQALGYEQEQELIGKPTHELFHHSYPDGAPMPVSECAIQQAIEKNTSLKNWRDNFWTKDNRAFPVEISVTSLAGGAQRLFGGVFVFRDISEQVRLEQDMKRAAVF